MLNRFAHALLVSTALAPAALVHGLAFAGILADLGIEKVRLLTNNTDKVAQLRGFGLDIVEQVPLLVGVGPNNHQYLATKRDRMGHIIDEGDLAEAIAHMKEGVA